MLLIKTQKKHIYYIWDIYNKSVVLDKAFFKLYFKKINERLTHVKVVSPLDLPAVHKITCTTEKEYDICIASIFRIF